MYTALRVSPSSLGRYLYELDRTGHIRIVKGNRYKGFEYKVQLWQDMETFAGDTKKLIASILQQIRSVTRIPSVTQSTDGLHNLQKDSKKGAVTHDS